MKKKNNSAKGFLPASYTFTSPYSSEECVYRLIALNNKYPGCLNLLDKWEATIIPRGNHEHGFIIFYYQQGLITTFAHGTLMGNNPNETQVIYYVAIDRFYVFLSLIVVSIQSLGVALIIAPYGMVAGFLWSLVFIAINVLLFLSFRNQLAYIIKSTLTKKS